MEKFYIDKSVKSLITNTIYVIVKTSVKSIWFKSTLKRHKTFTKHSTALNHNEEKFVSCPTSSTHTFETVYSSSR